ncbi:hypothetical protein [Agromyces subbeticus]|uniref:hypothetical protein n=1 Tax=Agromyces subbeticus TaxID=293890 RepID=UPI0003B75E7D|nr:hypothetical protein [Agromyces subbeticus]
MKLVSRFIAFPAWAKVSTAAAGAVIVLGAVSIPVAAVAVDAHNRQLSLEIAATEAAAEQQAAAEALADAKGSGSRLNAGLDGLTASLGAAVQPNAAAAFEAARVKLAFALAGDDLEAVSAAVDAVDDALKALVASAEVQAQALIAASPLAGASSESLARAVADLATADDVAAALAHVKVASDAVVVAQQAGQAAADAAAAAAKQAAEANAQADGSSGGESGDAPSSAGGSGHPNDPAITGMWPGERASCGENPSGQVVTLSFGWQAREGNTVDIYYALTDGDYLATGGFSHLTSGGSSGTVSIPVTCPVGAGPMSYVSVKAVASNANGSAASHYWGL